MARPRKKKIVTERRFAFMVGSKIGGPTANVKRWISPPMYLHPDPDPVKAELKVAALGFNFVDEKERFEVDTTGQAFFCQYIIASYLEKLDRDLQLMVVEI